MITEKEVFKHNQCWNIQEASQIHGIASEKALLPTVNKIHF